MEEQNDLMPLLFNKAWQNWLFVICGLVGFAMVFVAVVGMIQGIISQL